MPTSSLLPNMTTPVSAVPHIHSVTCEWRFPELYILALHTDLHNSSSSPHNEITETTYRVRSRDSSVGIATGYGLDDWAVRVKNPGKDKNFIFSTSSRPALGSTQPPIQWVPGALSPEVKRQGREDDHSPPTCVEVKKMWIYTSTLPYAFMA
jgi:hypothetical protein